MCNISTTVNLGSMSESDMSVVDETYSQDYLFVKATLAHPIMFDKSQTPEVRMAKKEAVEVIQSTLAGLLNKQMTSDQIFKKFNNLKTHVRKKILLKKSGNKHVVFNEGEQLLLDVMEGNNAAIQISEVISCEINPSLNEANNVETTKLIKEKATPLPSKKRHSDPIFDFETEETKKLSNLELQRMALLLQIDYLRSKKARLPSNKNIEVYDANGNLIEIETQPIQICSFKQK